MRLIYLFCILDVELQKLYCIIIGLFEIFEVDESLLKKKKEKKEFRH